MEQKTTDHISKPVELKLADTVLPQEINLNAERNGADILFGTAVSVVTEASLEAEDARKLVFDAQNSGLITPVEAGDFFEKIGAAKVYCVNEADQAAIGLLPDASSFTANEITGLVKTEKIKPLDNPALDEKTRKRTAQVIQYFEENSGYLDKEQPEVKYLQDILNKMKDSNSLPTRVLVALNTQEINAYSLADGTIIITQELINTLDSLDETAAILAHEQAHFERNHYKKTYREWYGEEYQGRTLDEFAGDIGLARIHEMEADFATLAKLDGLGVDTMVFGRAIRKVAEGGKTNRKRGRRHIGAVHGSDLERQLNILEAHGIMDFASSTQDEKTHTKIPAEWKYEPKSEHKDQLKNTKYGKEWEKLLQETGPVVLQIYISSLKNECNPRTYLDKRDYLLHKLSDEIKLRDNIKKMGSVFNLLEQRLKQAGHDWETARMGLLLNLTHGINCNFEYWNSYSIKKPKGYGARDLFYMANLYNKVRPSDFSLEAISRFVKIHQEGKIYTDAGLPLSDEPYPHLLLGNQEGRGEMIDWFYERMQFDRKYGRKTEKLLTAQSQMDYLWRISQEISKGAGEEIGNKWFIVQSNGIIYKFIDRRKTITDLGNKRLMAETGRLLADIEEKGYKKFTYQDLWFFAKNVYGPYWKEGKHVQKRRNFIFEVSKALRTEDPVLVKALAEKDWEKIGLMIKKGSNIFLGKAADLVARGKMNEEIIGVLLQGLDSVPELTDYKVNLFNNKNLKEKVEELGILHSLNQTERKQRDIYGRLRFGLDLITVATSGMDAEARLFFYRQFFQNQEIRSQLSTLPLEFLDELSHFLVSETLYNHLRFGDNDVSFINERRFGLADPIFGFLNPDKEMRDGEAYSDFCDRIIALPLFDIYRDRLLQEILREPTLLKISGVFEYYNSLLSLAYGRGESRSLWGYTLKMSEHLDPLSSLMIKTMHKESAVFLEKEIINNEETVVVYDTLRDYLPTGTEKRKLLGKMMEKMINKMNFSQTVAFLEKEAMEDNLDLWIVAEFIENKLHTREEFLECKQALARLNDNVTRKPRNWMGVFSLLDSGWSYLPESYDMVDFLQATLTEDTDENLRNFIAPFWYYSCVVPAFRRQANYRINERGEVYGAGAHNFLTFNEIMERTILLSPAQKRIFLRKLLLAPNGVLTNEKYFKKAVGIISSQLKEDPLLSPLISSVLLSALQAGDPVSIFSPIANALVPMMLKEKRQKVGNTSAVFASLWKRVSYQYEDVKPTKNQIRHLLDLDSQAVITQALIQSETTKRNHHAYRVMIDELNIRLGVEEDKYGGKAEKMEPMEAVIQIGQALGPVGARFLQVMGQYIDLPSEMQEKFREVYDSMPGQSKYTAFALLERLAKNDSEMRLFLDNELVSIDEKLGGGSIMTTYAVTTKDTEGNLQKEVLKFKNPNAERFVMESIKQLRAIVLNLQSANRNKKADYEMAERLLNTIEEWVLSDIRDPNYLTLDPVFARLHDGEFLEEGVTVKVAPAKRPNNIYVQREPFVGGRTLNQLFQLKERGEEQEKMLKTGARAQAHLLTRQLTHPAYYKDKETPVYLMLSDIHSGNVFIQAEGAKMRVCPIDRHFYQELLRDDILLLRTLLGSEPPEEKLGTVVGYFLRQPENRELELKPEAVSRQIMLKLGRAQILSSGIKVGISQIGNIVAGKGVQISDPQKLTNDVLHELDNRGVKIPLRMRLLLKNTEAINHDLKQTGQGTFVEYFN